jgi:hypothetical protein
MKQYVGLDVSQKETSVCVRLVGIRRDIENQVRSMIKEHGLLFRRAIGLQFITIPIRIDGRRVSGAHAAAQPVGRGRFERQNLAMGR